MKLKPTIRIHPDSGEVIYFYSIQDFEAMRNEYAYLFHTHRQTNESPFLQFGSKGHKTEPRLSTH